MVLVSVDYTQFPQDYFIGTGLITLVTAPWGTLMNRSNELIQKDYITSWKQNTTQLFADLKNAL